MDDTRVHAQLRSVASCRPRRSVSNARLAPGLGTTDAWIQRRTGVEARGVASAEESLDAMAARAAASALERAGLTAADLDFVLAASMSPGPRRQALAELVAERLIRPGCPALDVNAACAGFCYALELARSLVADRAFRAILVVGADRMTDLLDPDDVATAALFADGAGAAVVTAGPDPGIGNAVWGSDTSRRDLIHQDHRAQRRTSAGHAPLTMSGPSVYRWALQELPNLAREAVARAGVALDDLAAFIPHQSNGRVIAALASALELAPEAIVASDIVHSGNTAAASIPMAMERLLHLHPRLGGELALLLGYGAGMSYAAQVVRLPPQPPPTSRNGGPAASETAVRS
ncbi:beta-ketoacyl-ACP synthase 3 [Streptomyces sp. CA-249302]|uniref:beta-ketoacyl-ACP synthase 3 n=1 Tax=Streptomyces sp. CA-249302 TaxID=3240058 RepID=UPI003D8F4639